MVYIVDPSKRRPSTKYKFEFSNAVTCEFSSDGKFLLIADLEKLTVFDLTSDEKVVHSWSVQVKKIRNFDDMIMALTIDGKIYVYKIGEADKVCSIIVNENLEIIDFTPTNNKQQVLISWLNVNEPNFESLSLKEILGKELITINEDKEVESVEADQKAVLEEEAVPEVQDDKKKTEIKTNKKASKTEQAEIAHILSSHLESNSTEILDDLMSDSWTESEVKKFIVTKINTMDHLSKVLLLSLIHI